MSYTDFKEVANVDPGDTVHYGSDQLLEIIKIFNNKVVANRRPNIKNPWRFSDHVEIAAPSSLPTAPTSTNYVHLLLDPSDFHLKLQKSTGALTDLETFTLETNTLSYASPGSNVLGDILKNDGTKYGRFARGTNNQVLKSTSTDITWGQIADANVSSSAAIAWTKIDKTGSKIDDIGDANLTSATNGQVPTWNSSASRWDAQTPPGSSVGEANTASNQGVGGVGVFNAKVGVDLQFKNINSSSNRITVTNDTTNKEIDIDVSQANLSLSSIGGAVTDAQTPTTPSGKTYNIDTNTIKNSGTNAQGDLLAYDTTLGKYVRIPRGTNGQYLKATSTDIAWTTTAAGTVVLGGVSVQSGDGTTKIFNIAHGAGVQPTKYSCTPVTTSTIRNPNFTDGTANQYWVNADATNLKVNYQVAPATGVGNVTWAWMVAL
jgi:hypothetical protein